MKYWIIFWLFITFKTYSCSFMDDFYISLAEHSKKILSNLFNGTEDKNFSICKNSSQFSTSIRDMYIYSGKALNDTGEYQHCIDSNLNYIIYRFYKDSSNFFNRSIYYYGLCIIEDCKEVIKTETFISFLVNLFKVDKFIDISASDNKKNTLAKIVFHLFLSLIPFILCVKIIALIINKILNSKIKENESNLGMGISFNDSSSLSSEELINPFLLFSSNITEPNNSKKPKGKCKRLLDFLDFGKSWKILFKDKTKYYNRIHLEIIYFIKTIVIILLVYNHNYYCLSILPIKNNEMLEFYLGIKIFLYKFSTFALPVWISLEGFITCFKFFNFLSKKGIKLRIWTFVEFYLYSLSKIITSIFIFFMTGREIRYLSNSFTLTPSFLHFQEKRLPNFVEKYYNILIPFYFSYADYIDAKFSDCYKFVYVIVNINICFILFLIITYISIKLKSIFFDSIIFILVIVNGLLFYLYFYLEDGKNKIDKIYSINILYGEIFSTKYTHFFASIYFLGVFAGGIYFYYIDILSLAPLDSKLGYNPFYICFKLMKKFDVSYKFWKIILLLISIGSLICLILTQSFFIAKDGLQFKMDYYCFIYVYEKIAFVVFFNIILLIIIFQRGNEAFKSLCQKSIFTLVERLSFSMFCTMENLIYIFYAFYPAKIVMDFINLLLTTMGLVFTFILFNMFLYFSFEQPLRILIKKFIIWINKRMEVVNITQR